jgi:hypothetical protein
MYSFISYRRSAMSVPTPKMYYIVTKTLAVAMREGRRCNKGTVYGIYADPVKALTEQFNRGLALCTEVVEQ